MFAAPEPVRDILGFSQHLVGPLPEPAGTTYKTTKSRVLLGLPLWRTAKVTVGYRATYRGAPSQGAWELQVTFLHNVTP